MSRFSRYALSAALAALALTGPAVAASLPSSSITILSPGDLVLTGDSTETLTIRNDTSETVGLQFSVGVPEETTSDGTTTVSAVPADGAEVTVLPSTPTVLPAHAVGQFDLEIETDRQFDGVVCVGVNGMFASDPKSGATIPLHITPTPWWKQPTWIVLGALAFGAVVVFIRWIWARSTEQKEKWSLNGLMGAVEWDFSKSFGTVTGLFAGVITAVAETGLLPEADTPTGVSLLGLSLVFSVLLLVAPLAFTVWQTHLVVSDDAMERRRVKADMAAFRAKASEEKEVVGYVLPFLVTSALTIGAVAGQACTTYLMLEELRHHDALAAGVRVLEIALIPAGLLLLAHFLRTLGWIIEKQHERPKPSTRRPTRATSTG